MRHINRDDQHEFSMDSSREFNMDHSIIIIIIIILHSMGSFFSTNIFVLFYTKYEFAFFWLAEMNTQQHNNFRFGTRFMA